MLILMWILLSQARLAMYRDPTCDSFFSLFYFFADKRYFPELFSSSNYENQENLNNKKVAVRTHHFLHRIFTYL